MIKEKKLLFFKKVPSFVKDHFVTLFAIGLGVYWHVFNCITGLSTNPDSGYYLSYALRMHYAGDFFVHAVRPPLYSFLVNVIMFFNGSPADAAAILSGITMVLTLVVFALIIQRFSKDVFLNVLLLLALFTFSHFALIFTMVMSEGLFTLFLLLTVYYVIRHHETGKSKFYILASVSVSCAVMTRFMGYALIAAFLAYTAYHLRSTGTSRKKVLRTLAWTGIIFVPLFLFLLRNYLVTGTLHGYREPTTKTLFYNLYITLHVLGKELSFYLLALVIISFIFFVLLLKKQKNGEAKKYIIPFGFVLLLLLMYTGMLIYTTSSVEVQPITTRYFSPVYPLFFLFIAIGFSGMRTALTGQSDSGYSPIIDKFALVFLYCFLAAALLGNVKDFSKFMDSIYRVEHSRTCNALVAGYDSSLVAKDFAAYFHDAFKENDIIYVSGIYEIERGLNYPHLARIPFFRRSTMEHPEFSRLSFKEVFPGDYKIKSKGFTITLNLGGRKKSLVYRNLPKMKADKRLLLKLLRVLNQEKIKVLHLIVNNDLKNLAVATKLSSFLPDSLKINAIRKIGAYQVFQITLE